MNLAQALSSYFTLNVLLALGFCALACVRGRLKSQTELKLHYTVLALVLGFTFLQPNLPRGDFFQPPAKVWTASSSAPVSGAYISVPTLRGTANVSTDRVAFSWTLLGILVFLVGGIGLGRDLWSLLQIKRKSFLIRRIGRVGIYVNDEIHVPFSYWLPGQANVVVPSGLLARREDYKIALLHELQHHRHDDTKWIYVMWGLRLVCVINPFIHLWNKWIAEVQEFACDETLVDQNKVESQAYARCLVEVAQSAVDRKRAPVCATGLTFLIERNILKRRIEKMFAKTVIRNGRSISMAFALVVATVMGTTVFALNGLVQDRRVTMAQALELVKRSQSQSDFPVIVNEKVLAQLNRYIGTPDGREFMRSALRRMKTYQPLVNAKIREYGMPQELAAVPLIEAGYENLSDRNKHGWGAGLWMFIKDTARRYGLRVNHKVDERLDETLLTDAAMRYFRANQRLFSDWHLTVLSYNMGEHAVQEAIDSTGSRNAWTLIERGYEGDKNYLPRLMAAIIIMRNPESLN